MSYSRDSGNDLNYNRGTGSYTPNILYGYTNSSIEGIQLYAWTCEDNRGTPITIYTTTETPMISSTLYDINGNVLNSSDITWNSSPVTFANASSSSLEFFYY